MNMNMENPEELIKQAQAGDEVALTRLYDDFYTPVYRYLYFRTRDRAEAEDLAQETFLRFYQTLQKYQYRGVTPLALLFRIARNCMIDARRKKSSYWLNLLPDWLTVIEKTENPADTPINEAEHRELSEIVRVALSELPEAEQEAVTLCYINDLSYSEIAQLIGKNEEAIRQAVSRALKKLREYFIKNNLL